MFRPRNVPCDRLRIVSRLLKQDIATVASLVSRSAARVAAVATAVLPAVGRVPSAKCPVRQVESRISAPETGHRDGCISCFAGCGRVFGGGKGLAAREMLDVTRGTSGPAGDIPHAMCKTGDLGWNDSTQKWQVNEKPAVEEDSKARTRPSHQGRHADWDESEASPRW